MALGFGPQGAGHEIGIATQAAYEGFVRSNGLGFHPVSGDPHQLVAALLAAGNSPIGFARRFRRILEPLMERNVQEYLAACRGAEAVIYTPVGFLGYYVAEALGVHRLGGALYPLFSRTRYFPSSIVPLGKLRPRKAFRDSYNCLTYLFSEQPFWQSFRAPASSAIKSHLGLPTSMWGPFGEMRRRKEPMLYGWSPSVLPQPPDWGEWLRTTGFFGRAEIGCDLAENHVTAAWSGDIS